MYLRQPLYAFLRSTRSFDFVPCTFAPAIFDALNNRCARSTSLPCVFASAIFDALNNQCARSTSLPCVFSPAIFDALYDRCVRLTILPCLCSVLSGERRSSHPELINKSWKSRSVIFSSNLNALYCVPIVICISYN